MACESGRFSCFDCEESYPRESIFKCETCQIEEDTNSANQSNSDHFICDTCIIRHCKKGHKITDSVSQPVLVCDQHKILLNSYCRDCDILLCFKCMAQHDNHKQAQIEIRANEIRMQVFEQLTNFENMGKPARKQKERVLETTKANREKLQVVIKAFEKTQQSLLRELDDAEEKTKMAVESLLEKQNELRGLLSLSCQNLVHKWKYVEKASENVLMAKVDDESLITEDWAVRDLVMKLSNKWFESLGLHLTYVTDVEVEQKIYSDTFDGDFYVVVVKGDSIELSKYLVDKKKIKCQLKCVKTIKESNLSSSIESIKMVSPDNVILFMSDRSTLMADFDKKSITLCQVPTGRELLDPCYNWISGKVEWLYWENNHVTSTNNKKYKIKFKTKPKVMRIQEDFDDDDVLHNMGVFMEPGSMLITVVDLRTDNRTQIPQSVHGCNSIDNIAIHLIGLDSYLFCINMVLWSVQMKSITIIEAMLSFSDPMNFKVMSRINWTDDLEVKRYQDKYESEDLEWYIYFLPAVEVDVSTGKTTSTPSKAKKWAFISMVDF